MQTNLSNPDDQPYGRRQEDALTKHRLDQLEEAFKKVAIALETLVRLDMRNQENSVQLGKLERRVNSQGEALDEIMPELRVQQEKVSKHDTAIMGTIALVMITVGAKVLGLL